MMIKKETLAFLKTLRKNNHKGWFEENRDWYELAKTNFEEWVQALIVAISDFDPAIKPLRAKECTFRIFRDTRFAKDKSPYKTNFGAHLTPGGKKSPLAGYYFHLAPGDSFLGGGSYCPDPQNLEKIRERVADHYQELKKIISVSSFNRTFGKIWGEKLKTAPKGYPKDHPALDLLQYKSFVTMHSLTDSDVLASSLLTKTVKVFQTMQPFNAFLNKAF